MSTQNADRHKTLSSQQDCISDFARTSPNQVLTLRAARAKGPGQGKAARVCKAKCIVLVVKLDTN